MSKRKKIALAVTIFIIGSAVSYALSERLKQGKNFCISCHLVSGTALHSEKNRRFLLAKPENLAGLHKRKVKSRFSCPDCHTGHTFGLKLRVTYLEVYNTIFSLVGKIKEPKRMDKKLMPDANCTYCHKPFASSPDKFHGVSAHVPSVTVQCVVCHPSHPTGRPDYFFISMDSLEEGCKVCHPKMGEAFTRVLPGN